MKLHSNRRSYEKRRRLPQNGKTKNPKVLAASLAAIVISVVVLCMVVIIGVVGFSADNATASNSNNAPAKGDLHAWFIEGSTEAADESTTYEMSGAYITKDGVAYLPADGIAEVMGGTINYDKDKGTVKFDGIGKRVKLTVNSDAMKQGLFGSSQLDQKVYDDNGTVYVPVRSFFDALGYGVTYTASSKRIDIFVPTKDDKVPTATFSTDKDTYNVGEKIQYTVESSSPQGYEIVEEKWENRADWYFESGDVTISYAVKDYKGNWSETISKTIHIEGEYHAAESVPVLAYFYITKNKDNISKTVTEEKEKRTPDPVDPTKEIVTTEKVDKLVKGPFYGDDMVISLDQFKEEMKYLADNDFKTLTVSEYKSYVQSGVMPPKNSVLILFVNGYESTYDLAYPVLKDLGLKANIAPVVKTVEDRSPLMDAVNAGEDGAEKALDAFDDDCRFPSVTFAALKEMVADGTFEVGCVSYDSNRYGSEESLLAAPTTVEGEDRLETDEEYAARVKKDVTAAITVLCDNLGEENTPFFIYPFGATSDVLVDAVKNAGFSAAFVKGDGYLKLDTDLFHLERKTITQDMSQSNFKKLF